MNFDFSDDQNVLRDEVRKFLVKESPVSEARAVIDSGGTHADTAWQGLAGLGVTALMLPESCGGIGLGALELCVVAEEVGRQLGALPLASTLYLAGQTLLLGASTAQQTRWLPRIARGEVATLAAPLDGELAGAALRRFAGETLRGAAPLVMDGGCAVCRGAGAGQRRSAGAGHCRPGRPSGTPHTGHAGPGQAICGTDL